MSNAFYRSGCAGCQVQAEILPSHPGWLKCLSNLHKSRETCLWPNLSLSMGLADWLGNSGKLEKLCIRKVSSTKMYLFNHLTVYRILLAGRYLVRVAWTCPALTTQHKEEKGLRKNSLWEIFSASVSQPETSDLPPADGKRESPPAGKV